jgi:exodeoxyribonuclease-3
VTLRILSYNIQHGGVGREKQIAAVVGSQQPDVVILEEAIRPDIVTQIAKACGMTSCGATHGDSLAFMSRLPVASHVWHAAPFAKRRYLGLVLAGTGMRIFGVHLAAIHSNLTERRRVYELGSLLKDIAQHQHGFHVVTGDFNTLAPGEELDVGKLPLRLRAMVWMTGRTIRWRTIQMMLDAGYMDAYRAFHKDDGYTFPTWDPHVRLDYLFLPQVFAARLTKCEIVRDAPDVRQASDHFPLLSEIAAA